MLSSKKIILVFIPALLFVILVLFVRIVQYEPLFPDIDTEELAKKNTGEFIIPILSQDPVLGDRKSPVTIIAFEDFSCPACQQQTAILDNILNDYEGKVKIIWKGLPVSQFPYPSKLVHTYAYCANKQGKFEGFKNYAFTNFANLSEASLEHIAEEIELDNKKLTECLEASETELYIENTKQIAQILNIQAVPTFFINNRQINQPSTQDGWKTLLNL
ncbi:thioredoxin domain-containing protein [Candidatus Parcubacteria bacterium]|jgi:protein-disulfide isomerase|nr:thioredoxin domain-containing protein [Candidatus Parcubacteria bacterium]MBT3949086.1 thioredoxin domain-containing protein [Candidatus Parcubacteria bacterium]